MKFIRMLLLTLLGGIASCTLPDLKPFADATAQLQGAIVETGSNAEQVLLQAGLPVAADKLKQEWAVRLEVMTAVVRYTDALDAIAEAGDSGSKSAGMVGDAVNGLLGALSQPTLPSNYVDIAKSLYGIVASVRAANAFSEAVSRADPAIQSIASTMEKDLADLERIILTSRAVQEQQVIDNWDENNNGFLDYRAQLERKRRQVEKESSADILNKQRNAELAEINRLLAMTDSRQAQVDAELAKVRAENTRQIAVARKTADAMRAWAQIHAGLAADIEKGLQPNTRLLVATAVEIKRLLDTEDDQ